MTTNSNKTTQNRRPRTCGQCGRNVRVDDVYCPACGHRLDDNSKTRTSASRETYQTNSEPLTGVVCNDITHSRVVAALLDFFLGSLGVHNFYLGFYTRAICQLVLTVLIGPITCGLGAGAACIWAFIEGALILSGAAGFDTDARGNLLRD